MEFSQVNIWLWLALIAFYSLIDGVSAWNTIATNRLDRLAASNTSAFLYACGVIGSYILIEEGLNNIIPIMIGSWLGTYLWITLEKNEGVSKLQKSRVRILQKIQRCTKDSYERVYVRFHDYRRKVFSSRKYKKAT